MQKLSQLTLNIRKWNKMGYGLLPVLEIVIVTAPNFQQQVQSILKLLNSQLINYQNRKQSTQVPTVNPDIINSPETIYIMKSKYYGRIVVVNGISENKIKDQLFKLRKRVIQKYRKQKYIIFIVFTEEDKKEVEKNQQHLIQFGIKRDINVVVLLGKYFDDQALLQEIQKKFQSTFKYTMFTNYRVMKEKRKQVEAISKRYIQWKKVISKETNPIMYSLVSLKHYTDSMRSSFSGTFSSNSNYISQKSIHWKVMEGLQQFWDKESQKLLKQVDSFSLAFIEEKYKMSDYYSIGGFLPDTCFKAIFSPPLYQFRDTLLDLIQQLKLEIMSHVEMSLSDIFNHANIKEEFMEKEMQMIEDTCNRFISELSNSLQSQIQYIHASAEDFWNYRQINSNFYTQEQQAYIEIKYIGRAYVKKVYESIKDSVPRMIGQGLLKKIEKYLFQGSFYTFTTITKMKEFEIILLPHEIEKYESNLQLLKELQSMIICFSMKISPSFLIKNFHEKKQKEWDRMFGRSQNPVVLQNSNQANQKGGILNWMKNLFARNKENRSRRSNSSEKMISKVQIQNSPKQKKEIQVQSQAISQKNWLLIINTGREISYDKIKYSSLEGFPAKFRSSIWLYLSTRKKAKGLKLKKLLEQKPDERTEKQINKDLTRTSPRQVFSFSMKSSLRNILVGYSIYDKELLYTQGMNFIVAIIILTIINYGQKTSPLIQNRINYEEIQQKAFCILKYIMEECGVRKVMIISPELMADISLRLHDRIKQLSPQIIELIEKTSFSCQMIFSSPIISCLSNTTANFNLMKRFLDILITHDFFIVYKIIAQFAAHSQIFLSKLNSENIYDFLKNKMYDQVYRIVGQEGLTKMFYNL